MKKLSILALIAAMACGLAPASRGETESWLNEIDGGLILHFPAVSDFDLYELGFGLDLQYRNWSLDPVGLAFSLGVAGWNVDNEANDLGAEHTDFDGSVTTVPIGASVLFYLYGTQDFSIILEAGLRYMITDADVDLNRVITTDEGEEKVPATMEIDDGLVGLLAVEADFSMNEQFLLFGGLGYQDDIERGEITTEAGPLKDNKFASFFFRFGAKYVF